jgi:hypothetical protein
VWTPGRRLLGSLSGLGGLLAVVATAPTGWFGPVPDDSYVFDPPRFSALWVERAVIPAVAVLAVLLCLTGLLALFARDRDGMPRWQRWLAVVALIGGGVGSLATVLLVSTVGGAGATPSGALNALAGLAFALLATVLLLPGLLAWGAGYLREGRPVVGVALVGAPALSVLIVATSVVADVAFGNAGALPAVLPFAAAMVAVGYDLGTPDG